MFQVGERIRCVKSTPIFEAGEEFTVEDVNCNGNYFLAEGLMLHREDAHCFISVTRNVVFVDFRKGGKKFNVKDQNDRIIREMKSGGHPLPKGSSW